MTDIGFACPHCQQPLEAPPELAGRRVECPACKATLQIPGDAGGETRQPQGAPAAESCPECGADMEADAVLCIQCGFHSGLGRKVETSLS